VSRVLIAYYTRTGTTREVAESLRQMTGWAVGEVCDVQPRAGLMGDLRCVFESLLGRSASYTYQGPAIADFERLVLITPIWLDGLASPARAFLGDHFGGDATCPGRPVSLICVMSRIGAFRAADEITTIVGATPAPVLALSQEDALGGRCRDPLQSFVETIQTLDADPAQVSAQELTPRMA
jgi:flavodoxin